MVTSFAGRIVLSFDFTELARHDLPPALRVAALCLVTAFVALPAASSYLLRGYKTDRSTPAIAVKATPVARAPEASGITGKAIRPLARPY